MQLRPSPNFDDPADRNAASHPGFRRGFVRASLCVAALSALVFLTYPSIDLWASRHFYAQGAGFAWGRTTTSEVTRDAFRLVYAAAIALSLFGMLATVYNWRRPLGLDFARSLFLLACLAAGPGLVANLILKDHWGRARPVQVTEFGGKQHFTPPLLPASECPKNCAFVSGEAANIYAIFFAGAFIFPAWRAGLIAAGIAGGLAAGLMRMAQGGHFLSDVVFAGVFMALTATFLHWLMFSYRPDIFGEHGRLHRALIRLLQRNPA